MCGRLVHAPGHHVGDGCADTAAHLVDRCEVEARSLVAGAIGRALLEAQQAYRARLAGLFQVEQTPARDG